MRALKIRRRLLIHVASAALYLSRPVLSCPVLSPAATSSGSPPSTSTATATPSSTWACRTGPPATRRAWPLYLLRRVAGVCAAQQPLLCVLLAPFPPRSRTLLPCAPACLHLHPKPPTRLILAHFSHSLPLRTPTRATSRCSPRRAGARTPCTVRGRCRPSTSSSRRRARAIPLPCAAPRCLGLFFCHAGLAGSGC